ncbi:MAG: hypothetical protein J7L23_05140 [Candidatus Diapherotrites archaeon]|nr:hypothetical protein [Candidatus Diapherotrites archaeon]
MALKIPIFSYMRGETSVSDLKALSEIVMSRAKLSDYNIAMIRAKNYTVVGGKPFAFYNNEGAALVLEKMLKGELPEDKVLTDVVLALQSVDDDVYFDKGAFLSQIKKHLRGKRRQQP